MKTLTIKVTKKDIERGQIANPFVCPVALATKRAAKRPYGVSIIYSVAVFRSIMGDELSRYSLSKPAMKFIAKFDKGGKVKPATFKLTRISGCPIV